LNETSCLSIVVAEWQNGWPDLVHFLIGATAAQARIEESMTEDFEVQILDQLKAVRSEYAEIRQAIERASWQVGAIETQIVDLRGDVVVLHDDSAVVCKRLESLDQRLGQIECRLDSFLR
jgi:septation ring formation regulator EzrA